MTFCHEDKSPCAGNPRLIPKIIPAKIARNIANFSLEIKTKTAKIPAKIKGISPKNKFACGKSDKPIPAMKPAKIAVIIHDERIFSRKSTVFIVRLFQEKAVSEDFLLRSGSTL